MRFLHIDETGNAYQTSKELDFKELSKLRDAGEAVFRFRGNTFELLNPGVEEEPRLTWETVREVE